jgi:hypothetical protein
VTGRDYLADMNAAITTAMGDGDLIAPITAEKLHAHLLEADHDLLDGWLQQNAIHFLTEAIGGRDRHQRALLRRRSGARAFAEAAEAGDGEALSVFAIRYVVDEENTRRPVGQMVGADHVFVANSYRDSAASAQMLAAFHEQIAKTVGERRTAEVLTEQQYQQLYISITRSGGDPA